jgi:hypothetical protein
MVENLKKDPEINLNNNQNENEKLIKNNEEEKNKEEKIEIDKIKQNLINKQIELCKQLKNESDEYLKNNQLSKASNTYTKAVLNVKYLIDEKLINKKLKEELEKEILIPSNLNLSYIDIQNKNWEECIRHSLKVLSFDKNNFKARYRKCFSHIKQKNIEKAKEDFNILKEQNKDSLELKELEELFENNKKDYNGNINSKNKIIKKISNFNKIINKPDFNLNKNIEKKDNICNKLKDLIEYIFNKCKKKFKNE